MPDQPVGEDVPATEREHTLPKFVLVRRTDGAMGRVLRTDNFGVFVDWEDGPRYAAARGLTRIGGAIGDYIADLVALIGWLHPDERPDQHTQAAIRRDLGGRAEVLLLDVLYERNREATVGLSGDPRCTKCGIYPEPNDGPCWLHDCPLRERAIVTPANFLRDAPLPRHSGRSGPS